MITYLNGTIAEKQPTRVVLDVGGVGYELLVPLSSCDNMPATGEECKLLTYDYVREDQHVLFGFATERERRMFTMLLSISGIGPKLALGALSGMSVRELNGAVATGDAARISSISGIGKKTAERIVIELRDKLSATDAFEAIAGADASPKDDLMVRDAITALVSLGYKQNNARKMVKRVLDHDPDVTDVEEAIRRALSE